jgi:uncharacterized protein YoxC
MNEIQGMMKNTSSASEFAWTSSLKKIAGMFGIAFSAREVINFAKESINAFANTERSAVVLNNTLKNFGVSDEGIRSIEDTVSRLEKLTSFDDSQIRSALSNAVIKLGDVNLAMRTVEVAMEVARARNLDLNDAVQRLSLGLLGNSRGLKDLGINIKDFGDNAQLTAEQKLEVLNTVLNKVQGSVDEFNETTSGSMEKTKTSIENLKEAIGNELAPAVKDVSGLISGLFDKITEYLNKNADATNQVAKNLETIGVKGYGIYSLFEKMANVFAAVIPGGVALKSAFDVADKQIQKLSEAGGKINERWKEYEDTVTKVYKDVLDKGKSASDGIGDEFKKQAEDIKKSFDFWKPISLIGGNLPELAKFVGNLRNATITKKIVIDVNVKDQTSKNSQIGKAVGDTILDGLAYESHGTGGW